MGEALKYHGEIDPDDQNNSRTIMVQMVGSAKRVLEVGCATGYMSRALSDRGCEVTGIEIDPEAAQLAVEHCKSVIVGDVESLDLDEELEEERFEAILFGDVLEHLRDPGRTLASLRKFLVPEGFIVASIPNITHGSVRLMLMQGRFEYTEIGLLDRTHLRFFSRDSIEHLFKDAGLVVVEISRTTAGIFNTEIRLRPEEFAREVIAAIETEPEATTYQFIVKAVLDNAFYAVRALHEREEAQRSQIKELEQEINVLRSDLDFLESKSATLTQRNAELEPVLGRALAELDTWRSKWERVESRGVVRLYRFYQKLIGRGAK